mgnify:CR=1 FL=1
MTVDLTRDEMIAHIAEEWVDGLDLKDLLREKLIDYTEELEGLDDETILKEYKSMTDYES